MDGGQVPVSVAARHLGVSGRRVRQLVAAGELPAHRVGRAWLIPAASVASMRTHRSRRRRPLSPSSAAVFLGALDEFLGAQAPALKLATYRDRSRARARVRQLVCDDAPMDLLRAWLPSTSRRMEMGYLGPVEEVASDPGVALTGISHPLSGMGPVGEVEGQVALADLEGVLIRHRLVSAAHARLCNVVLHVADGPVTPARVVLALADWASSREDEQALALLRAAGERS